MENKYTDMDLILLHDEAPKNINFNSMKAHFLGHSRWNTEVLKDSIDRHVKAYNSMSSTYRVFLSNVYNLMFQVEYEDMPLFINCTDPDMNYIVRWRLKVGK